MGQKANTKKKATPQEFDAARKKIGAGRSPDIKSGRALPDGSVLLENGMVMEKGGRLLPSFHRH